MPLPANNNPIERPSIREEVYKKLLTWIMEGVLKPGEKIVDKELALHMGVSRTPVREAIRRLEDQDLVESAANRWTRISKIPPPGAGNDLSGYSGP
ncbi:GntR family transcriptional regulator [Desulfospira joergensenii]|uniref:GntR family transcriptional regulator n=1 Tax=Desulfospira joergensenii TaxID=53329 RepID=UPI0003B4328F|nr:GntR family transcriptional regulator [Desulfospira joergensenii]